MKKSEQLGFSLDRPARRARVVSDTSRAAAARVASHTERLREQILAAIGEAMRDPQRGGATADEVHAVLAESGQQRRDIRQLMEVRRRVSDLHSSLRKIHDTGTRRNNDEGNAMIVWALGAGA